MAALGEGELLRRFAARGDVAAFEALVGRLGPMVLGVCRRTLRDSHDVDDAFQATFLILLKRAGSIRDRDLLAPWLHGVAVKVAHRARADAARRSALQRASGRPEAVEAIDPGWPEVRAMIDEEIGRLPENHRRAVVLCDVEGLSREDAAQRLGWSPNMVRGRLERARARLRDRLTRRGVAPTGSWMALMVAPIGLPPALLASTTRFAVGGMATANAPALALSQGVLQMMMLSKLMLGMVAAAASLLSAMGLVATVASSPARPIVAQDGPPVVARKAVGRRLPDVAGAPTGGPVMAKFAPRANPGGAKPDLDAAPKEVAIDLSGVVVDLDDRPVPGATVYAIGIRILDDPKLTIDTITAGSTTTGKDGSYKFAGVKIPTSRNRHVPQALTPYVRYKVIAEALGLGMGWHADESMDAIKTGDPADIQGHAPLGTPVVMNVYLRPEADLRGRVVDEAGQPLAGVKVGLHDINLMDERGMETTVGVNMNAENWPARLSRVWTDANGWFRLPGLPAESCCWLSFDRAEGNGSRWLYASTLAESMSKHGEPEQHIGRGPHELYPRNMTVSMPTLRTIEVRVVADDDGKAVPKVVVNTNVESLATGVHSGGISDAEGRVMIYLPSGRHRGLFGDPESTKSRFLRTHLQAFEVEARPEVQRLELRMKPGFELLIEAADESTGRGVPDVSFEIRPEKGIEEWTAIAPSTFYTGSSSSGPDGKFRALLRPEPGKTYRVRVAGAEPGDPTLPPPTREQGRDAPPSYEATPNVSDVFEPMPGRSATFRFKLKKR